MPKVISETNETVNNCESQFSAVVAEGGEGALAPPEFGDSEERTEREMDTLLLSAPPGFESLTSALEEDQIPVAIPQFPDSRGRVMESFGELESLEQVKFPDWIEEQGLKINFTQRAISDLEKVPSTPNLKNKGDLKQAIMDVLQEDPRSNYRRDKCTDKLYFFTVDNVKVTCWFDEDLAEVLKIALIK